MMDDLRARFGDIDIYLFDQLLRGRIPAGARILDAGCGGGRNLVYLLRSGYDVYAIDADPASVAAVQQLAASIAPGLPADRIQAGSIEAVPWPDRFFGVVLCSAVLHFARDSRQFDAMVAGLWRVLEPSGLLFARLASSIGMADRVRPVGDGRFALPDGSVRYLVDESTLVDLTRTLGGSLADPIKTTVVQDQRCMTTWVVRKD